MTIRWSVIVSGMVLFTVLVSATAMQAQALFSIRAASVEPVDGWLRMRVEHCQSRCFLWISPIAAIVASDIETAQPEVRPNGDRVIAVVFTDAGAQKLRDFTRANLNKFIAMIVDDRLIWAPLVRAEFSKKAVLTGNGQPRGLTQEEVGRIMAALGK
jgi:preprotein translocase subunit SecD